MSDLFDERLTQASILKQERLIKAMNQFTDIFNLDKEELKEKGLEAIELLPLAFAIRARDLVSIAQPADLKTIAEALTAAFGSDGMVGYAHALKEAQKD